MNFSSHSVQFVDSFFVCVFFLQCLIFLLATLNICKRSLHRTIILFGFFFSSRTFRGLFFYDDRHSKFFSRHIKFRQWIQRKKNGKKRHGNLLVSAIVISSLKIDSIESCYIVTLLLWSCRSHMMIACVKYFVFDRFNLFGSFVFCLSGVLLMLLLLLLLLFCLIRSFFFFSFSAVFVTATKECAKIENKKRGE